MEEGDSQDYNIQTGKVSNASSQSDDYEYKPSVKRK